MWCGCPMIRRGFFRDEEINGSGCGFTCSLQDGCINPKIEPSGKGALGILIVAEAPGEEEDKRGTQLVGRVGSDFRSLLSREFQLNLDHDFRKTNAVRCRPPKNRKPTGEEVGACRDHLLEEIKSFRPRVIISLGGTALESLIGDQWTKDLGGISRWRGFRIPNHRFGAWVCPTWHPSYVARMRNDKKGSAVEPLFVRDLKEAIDHRADPLPSPVDPSSVMLEKDPNKAAAMIRGFQDGVYAVDFETTGLRPHSEGHRIVCAAISNGEETLAFPVEGRSKQALARFMEGSRWKKVAAHVQFEDLWSSVCLGKKPDGWVWDTMLAAHVLDNRQGITGLKFQAFVHLGLVGYDDHVHQFLEAGGGANTINSIDRVPLDRLLLYCGLDALSEFRLFRKQEVLLRGNDIPM